MDVLVINCGSSSIKYRLYDMSNETVLAKGMVEKLGAPDARLVHEAGGKKLEKKEHIADHAAAFSVLTEALIHSEAAAIQSTDEIAAVGHRVVHGGEGFTESVQIDDKVIALIEKFSTLAPLHNPPNLVGIQEAMKHYPNVPHVAVFDTAFHETMPPHAYMYPLPYDLYEQDGIRKYGFHGTSHRIVAERAAKMCNTPVEEFSAITCHLGNGCSLAAIKNGQSVDTSMGLTPLEGVPMGTRTGDVDPAVVFFIAQQRGLNLDEINNLMNKKSGLLGISGVSNDMRELSAAAEDGNERAALALDVFAYRIKKYIGSYMAALGHTDAIVFTGGIGENQFAIREKICSGLEELGACLDEDANNECVGKRGEISTRDSRVKLLVVPTNEELVIARDTARISQKLANSATTA